MGTARLRSGEARVNSIAFIAFTRKGCELAGRLAAELADLGEYRDVRTAVHGPARFGVRGYGSLDAWTARHFAADDALVFVGAAGIAVRAIAPHVADKFTDPAVVSIDEAGRFAVPLLSGHVGGANALARALSGIAGGQAAVSTATDVNGVFAVDEWAARHGMNVAERDIAKAISARLLEGGAVGYALPREDAQHVSLEGAGAMCGFALMRGMSLLREELGATAGLVGLDGGGPMPDLGFAIGIDTAWSPFAQTLHLVPRLATVGVGCRRGVDPAVLEQAVDNALARAHVSALAVRALATIDVKRDEPAVQELAARRGWELRYYPADALRAVPGAFSDSPFVEQAVGVGNVCERAAVAQGGALLLGKQAHDGVTVAVALGGFPSRASGEVPAGDMCPSGALDGADPYCVRAERGIGAILGEEATEIPVAFEQGGDSRHGAVADAARCESEGTPGEDVTEEAARGENAGGGETCVPGPGSLTVARVGQGSLTVAGVGQGSLAVVGIGPGGGADLTERARRELAACDALVGYPVYVDLVQRDFPGKEVFTTPMRQEVERCRKALELAGAGHQVALVCSGDAGVYGMAGPVLELACEYPGVQVKVVPGVSAANAGAALLGAPLTHDWCCISLSDLLTPWDAITRRLEAAAESGMGIVLYNPASHKRPGHLRRACDILLRHLGPETVCGMARNIGRAGEESRVLSLAELREVQADMFTTVFVGNARTRVVGGRMVAPRGYRIGCSPSGEGSRQDAHSPMQRADAGARTGGILLFGGTTEGRELAEWLSARGRVQVVACCATEYGAQLVSGLPGVEPLAGPLSDAAKEELLAKRGFACIVDATHPYATHVSESLARLARAHGIPLLRLVREDARPGDFTLVDDMAQAAALVAGLQGNILLTTGTRDLGIFVRAVDGFAERLYVRVLPVPESVEAARALGIPASRIVAMQGPFSQAMNEALLRELGISVLVTKASGAAGGFSQKVEAARACGVRAVVVGRPVLEEGLSLQQVKRELEVRYGA